MKNKFLYLILILFSLLPLVSCEEGVLGGDTDRYFHDRRDTVGTCFASFVNVGFTNSLTTNMQYNCDLVAEMYITETSGCSSGGTWEPFTSVKTVTLSNPNALNTFYVIFRNSGLVETNCANAFILHDGVNPLPPSVLVLSGVPISTTTTPTFTYSSGSDGGSGLLAHHVEIQNSALSVIKAYSAHTSGAAVTGLSLTGGDTYTVNVKALDNAGNESTVITDTWVANDGCSPDATLPSTPTGLNLSGAGTPTTTQTLSWNASVDNCAMSHYEVAVGTTAGGTEIEGWSNVGNVTSSQRTGLTLAVFTNYYLSVRSVDASTNTSPGVSSGAWQIANPVAVTGLSNDPTPTKSKSWSWSCDAAPCTYRHIINTNATHTFTVEPYGATTSDTQGSGNNTYYIHVQAKDGLSQVSSVMSVSAILDNTLPTTPGGLTYAAFTTNSASSPVSSWTASTDANGVDHYEVALGTTSGGGEVVNWVTNALVLSKTFSGLGLLALTNYYISVRAHDQAGNVSTVSTGSAFQYDGTAPTVSSITTPADGNYATTNNLDFTVNYNENITVTNVPQLQINLTSGSVFATYLSGTGSANLIFRYAITGSDSDLNGITLVSPLGLNGGTLKDAASNNATLTFTPPDTSGITVNVATVNVTGLTSDPTPTKSKSWTWGCDAASCTYRYVINTNATHTFTVEPYGATTSDTQGSGSNTYYIHVQAKDGFGNESSVLSVSALIDNTSPTTPGGLAYAAFTTNSASSPASTWTASTDTNGVTRYEVALGTSSGGGEVVNWATNALVLSKTFSGLSLSALTNYYISVRAHDQAGNVSTVSTGTAFQYDGTAPTLSSVTPPADGNYTTGNNLDFTVNYNESVTVANTPQIQLNLTSGTVYATYLSGSGSANLIFRHIVAGGDSDLDGISSTSPLGLNGGTLKDAAGNNAALTFTPPDTSGVTVNIVFGLLEWDIDTYDYGSPGGDTPHAFTLTNNTGSTTGVLTTTLTATGSKFVILSDSCDTTTLINGATCSVDVQYKWKTPNGVDTSTLDVTDGTSSDLINISGTKN